MQKNAPKHSSISGYANPDRLTLHTLAYRTTAPKAAPYAAARKGKEKVGYIFQRNSAYCSAPPIMIFKHDSFRFKTLIRNEQRFFRSNDRQ